MSSAGFRKQRGVALITAILMIALATVLAVQIGFKAYLNQRRALTLYSLDQGFQVALGGEALAAYGLMRDATDSPKTTDFTQNWAKPIKLPLDNGGEIVGQLEDVAGRFNLNNLADSENSNDPKTKARRDAYIAQFKRILQLADIEEAWADKIVDWIDSDNNPSFPDGAEDDVYSQQQPPYRTANQRITRVSELLALPEFGLERYRKLEPLVTALPPDARINLCTAPGIVLDSFSLQGQTQFSRDATFLAQQRKSGCFPDANALANGMTAAEGQRVKDVSIADVKSDYFLATVVVTIGTNEFTLYSLLKRGPAGVRAVTRSFGSP